LCYELVQELPRGVSEDVPTYEDPVEAFALAWERVRRTAPPGFDPSVMTLATATPDGMPSARVVLLRGITARGLQFYTNYGSRKATDLERSGRAALCFYWHWLDEQVRIEGQVERTTDEESDAYFATRPRGSQLGAWASRQSEPLASRAALEAAYWDVERQYDGRTVSRPPFWGGYTIVPDVVEFWWAGEYRLHNRMRYTRRGDLWHAERLNP
jgi:pyridoxamine 5'-phosphate oxidase